MAYLVRRSRSTLPHLFASLLLPSPTLPLRCPFIASACSMSTTSAVQHDALSPGYWGRRWEQGDAVWHQKDVNPHLVRHLPTLDAVKATAPPGHRPRIFVPLCGASVDMLHCMQQGWHVVGLDAVEQPLRSFVHDHRAHLTDVRDVPTSLGAGVVHIAAEHLDLFGVDYFSSDVTPAFLGGAVDAVWDRGSFVAIGVKQREAYVEQLVRLIKRDSHQPNWLLNAFEYNLDSSMVAPPHSLPRDAFEPLVAGHASRIEVLDKQSSMARYGDVRNLKFFDVITYAITVDE